MRKKRTTLGKSRISQYSSRNKVIKSLGFINYREYLKSELWKKIRASVLAQNRVCLKCGGKKYLQIHHRKYTKANLSGKNIKHLIVLCKKCHRKVTSIENLGQLTAIKATALFLADKRTKNGYNQPSKT
jgi:5-methylcytosine-specific restriction endonuclease McrA